MPRVFISYSHDDASHKDWVRLLAERLIAAGIEVTLDQWDLGLGEDVSRFMETGIRDHDRVIVVCSDSYAAKANDGKGGVGYEKQIVTAELVTDLGTNKFIPLIRRNPGKHVPTFLGFRLYLDFDDDTLFEAQLDSLQREIYRLPARPKPALGANPYSSEIASEEVKPDDAAGVAPTELVVAVPNEHSARFRKLLRDGTALIDLDEWASAQVTPIRAAVDRIVSPLMSKSPTVEMLLATIALLENLVAPLLPSMTLGGRWASVSQAKVVGKAIKRLGYSLPKGGSSWYDAWLYVARIPFHLVSSAWMLGVTERGSFESVAPILIEPKMYDHIREDDNQSALVWLHRGAPFAQEMWKSLPGKDRLHFPFSARLEELLRPAASEIGADEADFVRLFDRMEAFIACLFISVDPTDRVFERVWTPLGSFVWRSPRIFAEFKREIDAAGAAWPPLAAGLFDANRDTALKAVTDTEQFVGRVRGQRGIG